MKTFEGTEEDAGWLESNVTRFNYAKTLKHDCLTTGLFSVVQVNCNCN